MKRADVASSRRCTSSFPNLFEGEYPLLAVDTFAPMQ